MGSRECTKPYFSCVLWYTISERAEPRGSASVSPRRESLKNWSRAASGTAFSRASRSRLARLVSSSSATKRAKSSGGTRASTGSLVSSSSSWITFLPKSVTPRSAISPFASLPSSSSGAMPSAPGPQSAGFSTRKSWVSRIFCGEASARSFWNFSRACFAAGVSE